MSNEPLQSLPYPAGSATPDVPADIQALALATACLVTGRFSTTSARDAAWTAYASAGGRSPAAGDKAVTGSGSSMVEWVHDGTAWKWYWSPATVPVKASISGNQSLTTSVVDLAGMTITVNNLSTSSVWEVRADLDTQVATNTGGSFDVTCVADGTTQAEHINMLSITNMMNLRIPASRTWRVTGMAAGTTRVIKLAGTATAAWWVLSGSQIQVKQVG